MAERWQQWMPFHIDKFRGSPEVQAMHPAARAGYIYLLASAWQSSDCTIANDPIDLATESGLGDELWAIYGPRILRKFEVVGDRLRNLVLFAEWSEALKVYEKRKSGAVRTNSSRSASDERTQSSRNTDTGTGTGTTTGTKTETEAKAKAKTLALTPVGVPAERGKLLGKLPLTSGEYEVREDDLARDTPLYPAVDVPREYRAMKAWLLANPANRKTKTGIHRFMNKWLSKAQNEATPTGGKNGKPTKFETVRSGLSESLAILEAMGSNPHRPGGVIEAGTTARPNNSSVHGEVVAQDAGGDWRREL